MTRKSRGQAYFALVLLLATGWVSASVGVKGVAVDQHWSENQKPLRYGTIGNCERRELVRKPCLMIFPWRTEFVINTPKNYWRNYVRNRHVIRVFAWVTHPRPHVSSGNFVRRHRFTDTNRPWLIWKDSEASVVRPTTVLPILKLPTKLLQTSFHKSDWTKIRVTLFFGFLGYDVKIWNDIESRVGTFVGEGELNSQAKALFTEFARINAYIYHDPWPAAGFDSITSSISLPFSLGSEIASSCSLGCGSSQSLPHFLGLGFSLLSQRFRCAGLFPCGDSKIVRIDSSVTHFGQLTIHDMPLQSAHNYGGQCEQGNSGRKPNHKPLGAFHAVTNSLYIVLHGLIGYGLCVLAIWIIWRRLRVGRLTIWSFLQGLLLYLFAGLVIFHGFIVTAAFGVAE